MLHAIHNLNYLAVLVTAIAGFILGSLWYSPVLFVKPWLAEMKISPEAMKDLPKAKGLQMMAAGFLLTLLSTFALAVTIRSHLNLSPLNGALIGGFVGVAIVGARQLNTGVWAGASTRLLAINVGYEIALFTMQGAILGAWR